MFGSLEYDAVQGRGPRETAGGTATGPRETAGGTAAGLRAEDLIAMRRQLAGLAAESSVAPGSAAKASATSIDPGRVGDAERIDQLRALEELKSAAAAAQARVTADFDSSQRRGQAAAGVAAEKQGAGVAAQVGLARRDSPVKGARHVGLAKTLVGEMPHTFAALQAGEISEWRATLLARETAHLPLAHRQRIDADLAPRMAHMGDAEVVREAKKRADTLDPAAAVRRARKAESERGVSLRPTADTMTYLTGLLPLVQGVAAFAALRSAADQARAAGDPRSRGQVMADTLVERVTGQAGAEDTSVEVGLVMTPESLFDTDATPADVPGNGPIPAQVARDLVRNTGAEVFVRRLFTHPVTGQLVDMDSTRREFTGQLRHFLVLRDGVCRTPYCGAPIRHLDHVEPYASGGETTAANGQGLCEACNYAKAAPGWTSMPSTGPPADHAGRSSPGLHRVTTITPTGHTYTTTPPDPPGADPPGADPPTPGASEPRSSRLEHQLADLMLTG